MGVTSTPKPKLQSNLSYMTFQWNIEMVHIRQVVTKYRFN